MGSGLKGGRERTCFSFSARIARKGCIPEEETKKVCCDVTILLSIPFIFAPNASNSTFANGNSFSVISN
jgi:hypothetical protein